MKKLSLPKINLKATIVSMIYGLLEIVIMVLLLQNNSLFYVMVEAPDSMLSFLKLVSLPILHFFLIFEIYLILPMFMFFVLNWIFKLISNTLYWKLQLLITAIIALFVVSLSTINIGG